MAKKKIYTEVQRARMLYATYKNRLKGKPNAFVEFEPFKHFIASYYGQLCIYCDEVLTVENISLDHKTPLNREGAVTITNLQCITKTCNRRKGELTDEEFQQLINFMDNYPNMKRIVLKRLSQAGFMYFPKKVKR